MNNSTGTETTFYIITGEDPADKQLSPLQGQVLAYILKNYIVTFDSIRFYWGVDEITTTVVMQALLDKGMVIKVPTKKQVEELQLQNQERVLTDSEERQAKMQEKHTEIAALGEEYSRKRRELNRIFEKQEKARQELAELTKEDYKFYHGGN